MNNTLKIIKLSDKDKKTILYNRSICTESHGNNCSMHVEHKASSDISSKN